MRKIIKEIKGITLMELMVVLGILSVVILASLSVFENMNKAEKYFTKKGDQFLDKIFAYQTIREDFQYISPSFNFLNVLIPHPDHPSDDTKKLDFFSLIPDQAVGLLCRSGSGLINPKRTLKLIKGEKFSFLKTNLSVRTKLVEPAYSFNISDLTNTRNQNLNNQTNGTLTFKAGFYYGNDSNDTYNKYFKEEGYAFFFASENIRTSEFAIATESTYFPRRYAFLWKVDDAKFDSCDKITDDVCKTELTFKTTHPQASSTSSKNINTAENFLKFLPSFNSSIPVVLAQKVDIITYEIKDYTYQGKATTKLTRKINGADEEILAIDIDEVSFERPCIAQKNISVFLKYKKIDF